MHVVFVHKNYPSQFGHIADYLTRRQGWKCTFVSELPAGWVGGVERIAYKTRGGATNHTHFCSRTFENATWHAHAVFEALKQRPDVRPDLIVGHSGFGSTIFLRELYPDVPIINYFEYYYRTHGSDMDFRPEFPSTELSRLRARNRNAMILLDLDNCNVGYSPTHWQSNLLPEEFRGKLRVIFDGVDLEVWRPMTNVPRRVGGLPELPAGTKIVTYATRGMESMRGFDIFMKVAKRLCDRRDDVLCLVAGEDRVCYGGDETVVGNRSFKDWVLSQDDYDLTRILFTGLLPRVELARLFNLSDLHIYLTVPFVLSWSLMNALACGATVLASDTAPVREMVRHGENGLLADFFDVDGLVEQAERVLDQPAEFAHLGQTASRLIQDQYGLEDCMRQMLALYADVCGVPVPGPA